MNQYVSTQTEMPMPQGEWVDFTNTNKAVLLLMSTGLYQAGMDVQGNAGNVNQFN